MSETETIPDNTRCGNEKTGKTETETIPPSLLDNPIAKLMIRLDSYKYNDIALETDVKKFIMEFSNMLKKSTETHKFAAKCIYILSAYDIPLPSRDGSTPAFPRKQTKLAKSDI